MKVLATASRREWDEERTPGRSERRQTPRLSRLRGARRRAWSLGQVLEVTEGWRGDPSLRDWKMWEWEP